MVALFVALAGGATAGVVITGADILNGSVTSADIKNGTLRGTDIKNNSVLSRDIRDGQLQPRDFDELPAARVYLSDLVEIPADTKKALEFNRERFDTGNMHNNAARSRLTAPADGLYQITGQVDWAISPFALIVGIDVNGDKTIAYTYDLADRYVDAQGTVRPVPVDDGPPQALTTLYHLETGDYVELWVTSQGALNVLAGEGETCPPACPTEFMMHWVSPYEAPENNQNN